MNNAIRDVMFVASLAIASVSVAWAGNGNAGFRFSTEEDSVVGCPSIGSIGFFCVQAYSFVGDTGLRSGAVDLQWQDDQGFFHSLLCLAQPGLADMVKVNPGTGRTTVSAVIDPAAEGCSAADVTGPVVLELSGVPDGTFEQSFSGMVKETNAGVVRYFNFRDNCFNVVLSGTLVNFQVSGLALGSCARRIH